jgi:adenosylhomocysteine nucleosidase
MSVIAVTGLAFEARIAAGAEVRTVASGGDRKRLLAALEAGFARSATAIMSFGIAGGLDDALAPGTWVVADQVTSSSDSWAVNEDWRQALAHLLPGAVRGRIAGVDSPVAAPAEKRALRSATGALAVDMESHLVAAFAAGRGVPFAVFRVIADPASRSLAPAAMLGMRHDGTVDQLAVFAALMRAPWQLPALLRNALDTRTAVNALSRGRRLLGPGLGYPNLR